MPGIPFKRGDILGGKFELYGTVGSGGFGLVYLAYHREWHHVYALKTMRDECLGDPAAAEAFKKEAQLWVNMGDHPFILAARWVEQFYGRLFVVMDYIAPDLKGRVSLEDRLACTHGPLDTDQTLVWAIEFCHGMEHANRHGMKCHRDIKPSNILFTQCGTLKITDFGLALAAEVAMSGHGRSVVTRDGQGGFGLALLESMGKGICGTLGYIAPEVLQGEGADVRSDIYSFGLVLWQITTGSPVPPFHVPFEKDVEGYLETMLRMQTKAGAPRVGGPMQPVIEQCLAPEPWNRYGSFAELRTEMEAILSRRTGSSVVIPACGEETTEFWVNKGTSLSNLGLHDQAIDCYNKALEIDSTGSAAWASKGVPLFHLARYDEAVTCFNKALDIDPLSATAWINKAGALHRLGRYREAITCCNKAIAIDPLETFAWTNKGLALGGLGQREDAMACYMKALESDSYDAAAWSNRGLALLHLGRHSEAVADFAKALEINPQDAPSWSNMGVALRALGRAREATECYSKALEINARDASAWTNMGVALRDQGRHEEALECHNKAIEIEPRNAFAWNNKGLALGTLRYPAQEVIDCFETALDIDRRSVPAWCNKALALSALGQHAEAIACYSNALGIDPRCASALRNKADDEKRLGNRQSAVVSLRKYLDVARDMPSERQWIHKAESELSKLEKDLEPQ